MVSQPVRPFGCDQRIAAAPEKARRDLDARLRRQLAFQPEAAIGRGREIPVEAALDVARLHEVVDIGFQQVAEHGGIVARPVVEEMAEVEPAGLARAADQLRGPRQLLEVLIPDLDQMAGLAVAVAEARIGRAEIERAGQPPRLMMRHRLHDIGAEVAADHAEAVMAEPIHHREHIERVALRGGRRVRSRRRLAGIAAATQIGRDQLEAVAEMQHQRTPHQPELRPAMEQEQRRTLAEARDIDAQAADIDPLLRDARRSCVRESRFQCCHGDLLWFAAGCPRSRVRSNIRSIRLQSYCV